MTSDRSRLPKISPSSRCSICTPSEVGISHSTVFCRPRFADPAPATMSAMRLRQVNVGCFGGGTGLPSLLGGLKQNPWLHLNAVVTMFDSGGSSGQLRDELGVLPPGDVLK